MTTTGKAGRRSVAAVLLVTAGLLAVGAAPRRPGTDHSTLPPTALDETRQALHLLNRLAFGPRPGEIERIREIGPAAWIEGQLHPERVPDEEIEARLAGLHSLDLTPTELFRENPPRPLVLAALRAKGLSPEEAAAKVREEWTMGGGPTGARRVLGELGAEKVIRAVYSERQLQEVMVDFWANHFNVFAGKPPEPLLLVAYERDVLRPLALGSFEDLLVATAKSPAMLFYLDNWRSVSPDAPLPRRLARSGGARPGLNENYARELLELHTLGVDGGYTEEDVRQFARCLTGWSIEIPRPRGLEMDASGRPVVPEGTGTFVFRARLHDRGEKRVLGVRVPAGGGMEDALRVLHVVANHPSTARHISLELAARFVSDDPPAALVDRMGATFLRTRGDIREVLRTLFTSPEFWSADAYRAKVKSPFELAVSAMRGLGAEVTPSPGLVRQLAALGEAPWGARAPTGYPDSAEHWVNPGGLMARLNFSLALAAGRVPGARVEIEGSGKGAEAVSQLYARRLLGGDVSAETLAAVKGGKGGADGGSPTLNGPGGERLAAVRAVGMLLGSPEFQRR